MGDSETANTGENQRETGTTAKRMSLDCAFGIAILLAFMAYGGSRPTSPDQGSVFFASWVLVMCPVPAYWACRIALALLASCAGRLKGMARKSSRAIRRARGPVVMAGAAAAAVALLAWRIAPAAAAGLAFALPFALLLACGGYAAALVLQDNPRARLWADASVIITVAAGPAALFRPAIITDDPVAGLLFPAAAWLALQLWRSMTGSGSRIARAGADVTAALALGAILDLLLVWAANLAGAGILTVARACHLLGVVAAGNSPHWWYLVIPLLLLAAARTARARWKGRLARAGARVRRMPAAGWARELPGFRMLRPRLAVLAFSFSRRMMTFGHVGLLLVPLVGITTPALLERTLHGPLRARYVIAYEADRRAQAEILADRHLMQEVAAAPPGRLAAMRAGVEHITSTAGAGSPQAGAAQATPAQLAAAGKLGQAESAYLQNSGQAPAASEASPPALPARSLVTATAELAEEETAADEAEGDAEQAGAAAAAAIGAMLSIPHGGAAVQILQEYLGSLIEESPVADALARLAGRPGGADTGALSAGQALDPGQAEAAVTPGENSPSGGSGSPGSGDDGSDAGTGAGDGDGGDAGSGAGGGDGG
jgi:hypothetical protein